MRILIPAIVCLLAGYAPSSAGDAFDAPPGYYDNAVGTGQVLKDQLHDIIDGHTEFSYNSARSILQDTDVDPSDPDRIVLVYDCTSLDVSGLISSPGIPGWDSGASWNREHTWPRSRGVGSSGADNSDLHQLRPSDPGINGSRSNLNFGGVYGQDFGRVTDHGATVWYPGDADAGMIARQQFYMAVRYDESDANTTDLELASGNPGTSNLGDLDRLLEWHYQAVPDQFERRRNDVIFGDYQGNRNPFVDHPEFVHAVFVNSFNDTQLTIENTVTSPDGGSSLDLDFGRVIVGAALPATQTVTLNKSGLDGTYYEVTTSTDQVTSSVSGRYNAFARGSTGTRQIEIGLAGSTATAGLIGGEILIDNLDITNSYGNGRADDDADDVIYASLAVLNPSNASFARDSDVNELTIDFGIVDQANDDFRRSFFLYNNGDNSFVADLELDSIIGDGDTDVFSASVSFAFPTLPSGLNVRGSASLDTSTAGSFQATYTINTSDEDIPGGTSGEPLILTLLAEVIAAGFIDGDYDGDGFVSQADLDLVLLNWGDSVVPAQWVAADQFDGVLVSQNELDGVLLNWGNGTPPSMAIPEPTTAGLLLGLLTIGMRRNRR